MSRLLCASLAVWVLAGCRADPGVPDYSSHEGLREIDEEVEFLPGPFPFDEREPRLHLGIFYEGDATNEIVINDVDTHYYIFENTYDLESTSERVEGAVGNLITLKGGGFFGGGIVYDNARDLSDWTTLHVSLRSEDPSFAEIRITFLSGDPDAAVESSVLASDYGYANDGAWHSLAIPLNDVDGLDAFNMVSPFTLLGSLNEAGDQLYVDDLYYTQE